MIGLYFSCDLEYPIITLFSNTVPSNGKLKYLFGNGIWRRAFSYQLFAQNSNDSLIIFVLFTIPWLIRYQVWDLRSIFMSRSNWSLVNDLPAVRAHLFLTWTPVPQVTEHSPNSDQDPQVPSWNEQFVIHSYFMQNEQGTGSKLVLNMGHSWHISFFVYVFSPTT